MEFMYLRASPDRVANAVIEAEKHLPKIVDHTPIQVPNDPVSWGVFIR